VPEFSRRLINISVPVNRVTLLPHQQGRL